MGEKMLKYSLTAKFTAEVVYLFFIVAIILYKHHNKVHNNNITFINDMTNDCTQDLFRNE